MANISLKDTNGFFQIRHGGTLKQVFQEPTPPPPEIKWFETKKFLKDCGVETDSRGEEIFLLCDEREGVPLGGKPKPNDLLTKNMIKAIKEVLGSRIKHEENFIEKFKKRFQNGYDKK